MTFLEAAEEILREAKSPLHYKEITKRATERGLIETSGQTPYATMGAQLYMTVRRAEQRGETGRFCATGRGHFGLVSAPAAGSMDQDIQRINEKVKGELLEFLLDMHPRQLELLVGQLLTAIGFEDVVVTKYSGDNGIDVEATLTVGGVTRVRTAIQVKKWKNNVSGSTVRELRGGLMTDQHGLIITTAGYTKDALSEAAASGKTPIGLIDGSRLVDLLVENEIGIRRKTVPLLELNVTDLVNVDEGETGDKSASLWPLPGGQEHFFDTLLAFLDEIGARRPGLDEMTTWVMDRFEKVTKQRLVQSYLRSVLYSMGLIEFDGERIQLADEGEALRTSRDKKHLLRILARNILGIEEILEFLEKQAADAGAILHFLVDRLNVEWETDQQVRYRLQWLAACDAVEKSDGKWRRCG
jgi:hypothetical protein